MTALSLLLYILPVATGTLLVHALWPDRAPFNLAFKCFLGIGIGLGLRSLLYFTYLFFFAGRHWFLAVELAALVILLAFHTARSLRRRGSPLRVVSQPEVTGVVWPLLLTAGVVFLVSIVSTGSYLLRRQQGAWDAWMMYTRTARFLYIDQVHWLESFSPRMDPLFHADYPLLLGTNIAASWDELGTETTRVPMVQSTLLSLACAGLLASALGSIKSVGQAALGFSILWGIPILVNQGASQVADVPLALFILATGALFFLYVQRQESGLLALAGITTGLGAWTKNEGSLLVIGATAGVIAILWRQRSWRDLRTYAAGLAFPFGVVLYFKFRLAPPSDILSGGPARWVQQGLDPARHASILADYFKEILTMGNLGFPALAVGIIPILVIFYLLFRAPIPAGRRIAYAAGLIIILIQLIGYYGAYVITPYNLAWHLTFSAERTLSQVFPLLLFLVMCATIPAESVLSPRARMADTE
jgi:dolichyl-phosphate-mannose-protein mannosyltransferase